MESHSYRITAVIPTYNSAQYLPRAIRSVMAQTYPVQEIIVVDDGSTDDTESVVSQFGSSVKYIRQDNAGAAAARNTGINAAQGEWIAFLDADDEWLVHKVQTQVQHLQQHPDLVWTYSNYYLCDCEDLPRRLVHSPEVIQKFPAASDVFEDYLVASHSGLYMWIGTVLVKREVLRMAGMFGVGLLKVEDSDMWYRLSYRWPRVGYLSEPLSLYHVCIPNCVTRTYNQTVHMYRLVDRNLKLSERYGRLRAFKPVASVVLQTWMRQILQENRLAEIRSLHGRYGFLLPIRFRAEMWLRTTMPNWGDKIVDFVWGVKKKYRGSNVNS